MEPVGLDCADCGLLVPVGHDCEREALVQALIGMLAAYLSGDAREAAARKAVAALKSLGVDVDSKLYGGR